jgi:hypothetical protein
MEHADVPPLPAEAPGLCARAQEGVDMASSHAAADVLDDASAARPSTKHDAADRKHRRVG